MEYLLKHKIIEPVKKTPLYLAICEQLLKVLEDEIDKMENKNDASSNLNND